MNKQIKSFFQVLSSNIFVSFSGIFTRVDHDVRKLRPSWLTQ